MRNYVLLGGLSVAMFCGGYLAGSERAYAQQKNRLWHEIRIATQASREARDHIIHRFKEETQLMNSHGIKPVGLWTPVEKPVEANQHQRSNRVPEKTLIYILSHDSREQAEKNWAAFRNDPVFKGLSQKYPAPPPPPNPGPTGVEDIFLEPVDYSPLK